MAAVAAVPAMEEPSTSPAVALPRWRRWLIMFILLTGGIKTTLAFTTVVPALQLIAAHFRGEGDGILGAQFVVTMAPVGMATAGLVAGWIVSRGGLRRTLFLSLTACSITGLSQLWINSLPLLLADRFIVGCAVVVSDVAMTSILAAQFTGKARSRIVGLRQAISSAGTVSTMLVAGYLAQNFGWRAPSWMFLVPVVMLVLALIAWDRPIVLPKMVQSKERFSVAQLWPIYVLSLAMSVAHTMPSFQMPFLLRENGVTDAVLVSRVPALSAFISIAAAAGFGFVYGAIGRWTLILAASFMGIGFIGVGFAPTYQTILLCVMIEGVGAGWTIPFFSTRLLDRVTPMQRSQALGFLTTSLFLGHFINPILTAPLRIYFGIHSTFVVVGSALLVGALLLAAGAMATRNRDTII
ncbi:MFS transporter [Sphingomonas jatrophae]|uniref:Cyanate permease n=1 Tax=Sphingomonas jatrophae TaxID=1166337 RepID=A0A1I6M552_9SPHN|nr:MFS transporter [Sphingomonas jatrophae]SFS10816.1 Cyanate permease [Sphingomonas jatrophae]